MQPPVASGKKQTEISCRSFIHIGKYKPYISQTPLSALVVQHFSTVLQQLPFRHRRRCDDI
jgi:hypothetical protein